MKSLFFHLAMDTRGERRLWISKIFSFDQIKNMDSKTMNWRIKGYTALVRDETSEAKKVFLKILILQMLMWRDLRLYIHPLRRHGGVRKNRYGDKWRTPYTATEFLEYLTRMYWE